MTNGAQIIDVAAAFGADAQPKLLAGGMGTSWRASSPGGDFTLKPVGCEAEANWMGDLISTTAFPDNARIAQPRKSIHGRWIEQGFAAWDWIEGEFDPGRHADKLALARSFHGALAQCEKPPFIDQRDDPWAQADRVAFSERKPHYIPPIMRALQPLLDLLPNNPVPDNQREHLVHGDLSGNYVFNTSGRAGLIDLTPYWRPVLFAEAVLWVDTIWHDTTPDPALWDMKHMRPFVIRALIRRLAEHGEQIRADANKDVGEAMKLVTKLEQATPHLLSPWP